jgi:tetratricopeptide (TPR) repeat protein
VLDLAPEEWEVVGRIDGVSDVKKIAWTLGRSEFEVSKVVSKLTEQGLLELGTQEEVARTKPPHEVSLDLAATLIERGELDDARAKVDSVLKRHPEEPRAHFLTARVLEREGDLKAAAQGYENTLSFDPLAEEARLRLGLVRLKLGDIDGAAREWTAYLRMVGDTSERRRAERALTALRELQTILGEFDGREHA